MSKPTHRSKVQTQTAPADLQVIEVTFFDSCIYYLGLIAIFATPLIFSAALSSNFPLARTLLLYGIALSMLSAKLIDDWRQKSVRLPWGWPIIPVLLFVGVAILTTITSQQIYLSIIGDNNRINGGLLLYITYAVIGLGVAYSLLPRISLAKQAVQDVVSQRYRGYIIAIISSLTIVTVVGILEHFKIFVGCFLLNGDIATNCWTNYYIDRLVSTLNQPNVLASFLLFSLPIAIWMMVKETNRLKQALFWLICVATYATLWLTFSRAGLIGLGLGLTVLVLIVPWKNWRTAWPWIVSGLVACLAISFSTFTAEALRVEDLDNEGLTNQSGETRLIAWGATLEMIKDHPLLGTGPATYGYMFESYRPLAFNQTFEWHRRFDKPHNELLAITSEMGAIGLVAWIGLFVTMLWATIRIRWSTSDVELPQSRWRRLIHYLHSHQGDMVGQRAGAIAAGVAGMASSQLLGFSTTTTNLLLFVGLGLIVAPLLKNQTFSVFSWGRITAFMLPVAILVGVGWFYYAQYLSVSYKVAAAIEYQNGNYTDNAVHLQGLQQSLTNYEDAIDFIPQEPDYQIGLSKTFTALAELLDDSQTQTMLEMADHYLQMALQQRPLDVQIMGHVANQYIEMAKLDATYADKALQVLERSVELAPNTVGTANILAQLYQELGLNEQAEQEFNRLVEIAPKISFSYHSRATFYKKQGDLQAYLRDLRTAYDLAAPDESELRQEAIEAGVVED